MWPFRKRPEPFLDDPIFGRITFDSAHSISLWSSSPDVFDDNGFAFIIEANIAGPTDVQRAFFQKLSPTLIDLHHKATDFVKATEKTAILENLEIYCVCIDGDEECRQGSFTMEFSDKDANTIHVVNFKNYLPVGYGHDD